MVLSRPAPRAGKRRSEPAVVIAKTLVHLLALAPAAWLAWQIRSELLLGSGALGADPVAAVEHFLGLWAIRSLMVTLAVTPLRQVTGKPVLLRFRRMLGLYAFFYATLHFAAWAVLIALAAYLAPGLARPETEAEAKVDPAQEGEDAL